MASSVAAAALIAVALAVTGSAAVQSRDAATAPSITPSYVQGGDGYATEGTVVSYTLPRPVGRGHLLAVQAVYSNTGPVSVTDSRGDRFATALPPRDWADGYRASVLFTEASAGGATTVRATLGEAVTFAILYVSEYSGVDRSDPVDGAVSSAGRGVRLDSGALRTTSPGDLLYGAGASEGTVSAGGPGFRVRSFAEGNVVEDRVAGGPGSYLATATHGGGSWVMQAVAFRAARGAPGAVPSTPSAPATSAPAPSSAAPSPARPTSGTPAAPPSGSPVASACAYPKPSCTGVPAGTRFTRTVVGDYTATTPGQVIDSWHITGSLIVGAPDVTVRNTQVDNDIDNQIGTTDYTPFSVSDSTVGPAQGCGGGVGVGEAGFTATRVLVRGHEDGFRMSGSHITVQDSYAVLCYLTPAQDPPDGSHSDGIQAYCPNGECTDLLFRHNTIDAARVPSTNAVNATDPNLADVTVEDNLLMGGAYTIDAWYRGGAAWVFRGNRLVAGSWAYGPASAEGTCAQQSWSDNTVVTANSDYDVTATVGPLPCVN